MGMATHFCGDGWAWNRSSVCGYGSQTGQEPVRMDLKSVGTSGGGCDVSPCRLLASLARATETETIAALQAPMTRLELSPIHAIGG